MQENPSKANLGMDTARLLWKRHWNLVEGGRRATVQHVLFVQRKQINSNARDFFFFPPWCQTYHKEIQFVV